MGHLPSVLEALLYAEAEFERALLEAAPLPDGDPRARDHSDLTETYHRYIPSSELRWIAMLLFQLRAYGVTDAEAMRRFVGLHNDHVQALAADPEYCKRRRIPPQRLLEAVFSRGATENACINLQVYGRGRIAFDASTMKRLMVEFVGKDHVDKVLILLERVGLLAAVRGNYNAHVFIANGRLEDVFERYLANVDAGVAAAGRVPAPVE